MWFFLPRAWLLRRNRPQWGFVELLRCLTQTWCQMDDASPRWPIDAHGCASWLRRLVKLINFQWKTSCLPSVHFACYAQRWYPSLVHLGCIGDAVVFHVGAIFARVLRQVGPKCGWLTCHTAKSRCSEGTRAQSVLQQYIYKREPQCLFARICTLHTLAALHICYSLHFELLVLDLSRYGGIYH